MDRFGTEEHVGAGNPSRDLVVVPSQDSRDEPVRRVSGGRPMAGFLAQLIIGADPALRITRSERTRTAAALYALTAGVPGKQSS